MPGKILSAQRVDDTSDEDSSSPSTETLIAKSKTSALNGIKSNDKTFKKSPSAESSDTESDVASQSSSGSKSDISQGVAKSSNPSTSKDVRMSAQSANSRYVER